MSVQKAYAYATRTADRTRQLLVFEHRDHDAGVQVPGGTVEDGERPVEAAVRELTEETGVTAVDGTEHVGTVRYHPGDDGPTHRREFVHVRTSESRDRWTHTVAAGEADAGLAFECYWVPLASATVAHEMGARLDAIR